MEGRGHTATRTTASPQSRRGRILCLHEILFSANISYALGYALLVYIFRGYFSRIPVSDAGYYFGRSADRIDDLLHVPSTVAVSTDTIARQFPSPLTRFGAELLFVLSFLGATVLFLLFLRLSAGNSTYPKLLSRISGVTALLAVPACYLCVSGLTWDWVWEPSWARPHLFWQSPVLAVFAGEILGLTFLLRISRRRSFPSWSIGALLILHYGFWIPVLWPDMRVPLYVLWTPYILLSVFPLSAAAWLLYLSTSHAGAAEIGQHRAGTAPLAAAILSTALLLVIWFPNKVRALPIPKDLNSLAIQLSRGPCFGACPKYTITIHGSGLVEYVGDKNVKVKGPQTGAIGSEQIIHLLQAFNRAHFFALDDRAFLWGFDTPSVAVSVSIEGKTKRVVSDAAFFGTNSGPQAQFIRAAGEIDTVIRSDRWVQCDGGFCRP